MRQLLLLSASLLIVGAAPSEAQCTDGTPKPCVRLQRLAAAPRAVPSPEVRARRFLLLPFRNVTRGAAQEWLVAGAPLMLGEALGQFGDLTVIPEERLLAARRRLALPVDVAPDATQLRRLADETDGWTAISGNVFASGGKLRISVQAMDVPTSRVIRRGETEVAADADVRDAFNRLTVSLLEGSGVRGVAPDLAALTTRSVDAYRLYVQGIEFNNRSAYRQAQSAFAEAVKLDSTFALAWARLSIVSAGADFYSLFTPGSRAYRAIEQSARLASRLPPRQAGLVRSYQSFFRGQMRRARAIAGSLATSDRDDLDAREWLANLELMASIVDTASATPRLSSSMNKAITLARDVLERDPGRRTLYQVPAMAFGTGAGLWWGALPAWRHEYGSFAATMMTTPDHFFVPVLRDTLDGMLDRDFAALPPIEQARLRRRSADAAMEWIERWRSSGPADADAHLWASRISELRGDAPRALKELKVAEQLGIESTIENVVGRRVALLVGAREYAAAAVLADSLLASGALKGAAFDRSLDRRRSYSVAALLLGRRWTSAAALGEVMAASQVLKPACATLANELRKRPQFGGPAASDIVAPGIRRAIADTVTAHAGEARSVPGLAPCVDRLSTLIATDSVAVRPRSASPTF